MKTLFLNLAAAAALLAPVSAMATEATRDGIVYRYNVTERGAIKRISGTTSEGGSYSLTVAKGRVYGTVNGRDVSFSLADVQSTRGTAEVASR